MHGFSTLFPLVLASTVSAVPMFRRAGALTPLALVNVSTPVFASGANFVVGNFTVVDKNLAIEIACAADQVNCNNDPSQTFQDCADNVSSCEINNNLINSSAQLNNDTPSPTANTTGQVAQFSSDGESGFVQPPINVGSLLTDVNSDNDGLFTVGPFSFAVQDIALQVACLVDEMMCTKGAAACDQARAQCETDNGIANKQTVISRSEDAKEDPFFD